MLFTVFQYIPLFEEDITGIKVELAKKMKQSDLENGDCDGTDEDCDDDTEKELNYSASSAFASGYVHQESVFFDPNSLYKFLLEHEDTPPPKI